MNDHTHPYSGLPKEGFWRTALAEPHFADLQRLSSPIPLSRADRIATANSFFAQHIGARLAEQGANFLDYEPAPPSWLEEVARRHGFGMYSCRYGNIYTVRQLYQLALEALGQRLRQPIDWTRDGRHFDALRSSVDPVGHATADEVRGTCGPFMLGR